jgi:hypothetical protein
MHLMNTETNKGRKFANNAFWNYGMTFFHSFQSRNLGWFYSSMLHTLCNTHAEIGCIMTHLQNVWSGHSNMAITNKNQIHSGVSLK